MFETFLVTQLFAVLLVFARVGSGLMVLPGYGETYVLARSRLALAFAISILMMPIMTPKMPPIPDSPLSLAVLLFAEILVGIAIGLVCRLMVSSLHVAGMIIATQSGLAIAVQFDPNQASQGSLIGNLLSLTAIVMLFATDLHLVMIRALADSYTLFTPGNFPPIEDFAEYFSHLVSDLFTLGTRLSSPVLVMILVLYVGAGVLSRLMPAMQVFFILLPPQIFLSFFLLMSVFGAILLEFTGEYAEMLSSFLEGF